MTNSFVIVSGFNLSPFKIISNSYFVEQNQAIISCDSDVTQTGYQGHKTKHIGPRSRQQRQKGQTNRTRRTNKMANIFN